MRIDPDGFGTTTMAAHHSVGSFTWDISISIDIRSRHGLTGIEACQLSLSLSLSLTHTHTHTHTHTNIMDKSNSKKSDICQPETSIHLV